jgi:hypothetical protein
MTDYAAQAHWNNYDPSSFGWPRNADLVPFTFQGVNFGQCARAALPVFTALLNELVPLIPGGIDAVRAVKDDWSYAATDDLPDGSWSFHHYGTAFDLDWSKNPMGTYTSNPLEGQQGAIPHEAASRIARRYGCEWGGDWSGGHGNSGFKDFMHFEVHLSPDLARTVMPLTTGGLTMDAEVKAAFAALGDQIATLRKVVDDFRTGHDGLPHRAEVLVKMAEDGVTYGAARRAYFAHPDSTTEVAIPAHPHPKPTAK